MDWTVPLLCVKMNWMKRTSQLQSDPLRQLRQEKERLQREVEKLRQEKERLVRELEKVKQALEESRRGNKRQAAPFSKGAPKHQPAKPGRKPGLKYGKKSHRTRPRQIHETLQATLPQQCPACGGRCQQDRVEEQFQEEIVRQVKVTRFRVSVGHCLDCGQRVQSRHPQQTSDALGSAACQLGPEAISLAAYLNKTLGVSLGKIAALFRDTFGLQVTRGGISQALARLGRKAKPSYQHLVQRLRCSPFVTGDETGWRIGGKNAWLWAFANDQLTVYSIQFGRGFPQAAAILGPDYAGFLIHDGWAVYYHFKKAGHQSCLRHLLVRSDELLELAPASSQSLPFQVKSILLKSLQVRDRLLSAQITAHGARTAAGRMESQLIDLVCQPYRKPEFQRFAKHLVHEFPHLFTFLRHPGLDATNWRGEQAIRPAVVTRKVWGGNRTLLGAQTQAILASVQRTVQQQNLHPVDSMIPLLRSPDPILLPFRFPLPDS